MLPPFVVALIYSQRKAARLPLFTLQSLSSDYFPNLNCTETAGTGRAFTGRPIYILRRSRGAAGRIRTGSSTAKRRGLSLSRAGALSISELLRHVGADGEVRPLFVQGSVAPVSTVRMYEKAARRWGESSRRLSLSLQYSTGNTLIYSPLLSFYRIYSPLLPLLTIKKARF